MTDGYALILLNRYERAAANAEKARARVVKTREKYAEARHQVEDAAEELQEAKSALLGLIDGTDDLVDDEASDGDEDGDEENVDEEEPARSVELSPERRAFIVALLSGEDMGDVALRWREKQVEMSAAEEKERLSDMLDMSQGALDQLGITTEVQQRFSEGASDEGEK